MKLTAPHSPLISSELVSVSLTHLTHGAQLEDVHFHEVALEKVEITGLGVESVIFDEVELAACRLRRAVIANSLFQNCRLFGSNLDGAGMHRVKFAGGIGSGLVLSDTTLEDILFEGVKLSMANFRVARLKRVAFVNCDLSEADFQRAQLQEVRFQGCKLDRAEFGGAKLQSVDLRGSDVASVRGVTGLRGATIDTSS